MLDMIFHTATMTLMRSNGEIIAEHLPVQQDSVNNPWNMEVNGTIPTDWIDFYSLGWTTPVPKRTDYLVDEKTGVKYSVFATQGPYFDHLEFRCTQYGGETP